MSRRWTMLVALVGLLALLSAACGRDSGTEDTGGGAECPDDEFGCVEVAEGEPITLGSLLVIAGPNASLGTDSQHGVELAIDNLDDALDGTDGELMGHPVELVAEDEGCAAEGGQAGATRLASEEQIVAVIGTSCSSAAVPAAEILSEKGVLLISPSNTGPNLTDPDLDYQEFYARTAHNDLIQGAVMADFVTQELSGKTAATIHDGSPYAEGLANAFAGAFEEAGGTITTQEAVQVGQKDMKPVLSSIAADAPDFLYYPVFIPEGAAITQQAAQTAGLENTDLGGADGMLSPDFVAAAGDDSEGMYLSGPDLEFQNDFYQSEFLPAYEEQVGSEPSAPFHAHAFDATNVIFDAIESVAVETEDGGLLIPRTQLRDAVYDTEGYEGIVGTISCNDTGDCLPQTTIAVNQVKGGEFKAVFSEELSLEEVSQ